MSKFYCSFCGRHQDEVFAVVHGPGVAICDICVDDAKGVVDDKKLALLKSDGK